MPLVRKMEYGIWEIRSAIPEGIARLFFTVAGADIVLLHGFIKKSSGTPKNDLELARTRLAEVKNE